MDRYWLLTWTCYGTWLPGEARGFVGEFVDSTQTVRVNWNQPRTEYATGIPKLREYARGLLKSDPIWLTSEQAQALVQQFRETAAYRGWELLAAAIMANHVHVVVGVPGDPDPEDLLRDFKSYGSRALNKQWGKPPSGTWWTASGSKRKKADTDAVRDAVVYVRDQPFPLIVWLAETRDMASRGHKPPGDSLVQKRPGDSPQLQSMQSNPGAYAPGSPGDAI